MMHFVLFRYLPVEMQVFNLIASSMVWRLLNSVL